MIEKAHTGLPGVLLPSASSTCRLTHNSAAFPCKTRILSESKAFKSVEGPLVTVFKVINIASGSFFIPKARGSVFHKNKRQRTQYATSPGVAGNRHENRHTKFFSGKPHHLFSGHQQKYQNKQNNHRTKPDPSTSTSNGVTPPSGEFTFRQRMEPPPLSAPTKLIDRLGLSPQATKKLIDRIGGR